MQDTMLQIYKKAFGYADDVRLFFAPGRVNLIGEHTDYNGGHVLPCALTIGTYAAVRKRNDKSIRFYSENFNDLGVIQVPLDQMEFCEEHDWVNYPKGIIKTFADEGYFLTEGFDIVFYGTIPNGAGLSSSASLELVTCVVLNNLYGFQIPMQDMVRISQITENEYIGVQCGIMDQFSIGMGKKEHAILLNTSTMAYKYAELNLKDNLIIISNTNKRRGLADSKYNERHSECQNALEDLNKVIHVDHLCDLTVDDFEKHKEAIENDTNRKRAKHVIYENQRTLKALDFLNNGDLEGFGKLMNESHQSLKVDYEVTGVELDTLVALAQAFDGVMGSRMTGAGFGGCTVSIVKKACVQTFIEKVGNAYHEAIGYAPDFYVVEVGNGAGELDIK